MVSLAPSVTSILFAMGAREDVVAVSRWCREVADVRGLPELGDSWANEPSALARFRPTLIVGSVPYRPETLARLLEYPAPFLATNPRTLADIFNEIHLLGALVGRTRAARQLVRRMRSEMDRIARRVRPARRRPRIYAEAWPHPRISSPPWVAELIDMAGGKMVVPAGKRIEDAQILRAKPEIIVLAWTATGNRSRPESVLRNPRWRSVPAVKSKKVFVVPDAWLNTPGPPLLDGLRALAGLLQPSPPGAAR
ncbi:MAG TPA: ABC transporter substrate-binding protein [Patescibacteria group bacterium]|nr:ABC transporter substrate-binding protein [Patescibacteria group bacterium]